MLYHGTVPMKAENAVLILYTQRQYRGTTVEMFTVLWHLTMKSADGGGSGIETPLHNQKPCIVTYTIH